MSKRKTNKIFPIIKNSNDSVKDTPKKENNYKESIAPIIEKYYEEINWDDNMGEVQINGYKYNPFSREIWLPS